MRTGAVVALVVVGLAAAPAQGAERALTVSWPWDVAVALGAGGAWVGTEMTKDHLAPASCRWCADNALDRATRDALRWQDAAAANRWSNATAFVAAPVAALGAIMTAGHAEAGTRRAAEDGLLVAQAVLINGAVNQGFKLAVGRERPFVHALGEGEKAKTAAPADNNLSFFSGHTSTGFALAASVATVARLRGYRSARWLWAPAGALAFASGYLRLAADKHWLSDVAAGAVAGTAVGVAVPLLHMRAPSDAPAGGAGNGTALIVGPGGLWLAGRF